MRQADLGQEIIEQPEIFASLLLGIEDPAPDKTDHHLRKNRRNKKDHAVKPFHADLAVAGQGQSERQSVLKGQGNDRDVNGMAHRIPPDPVRH